MKVWITKYALSNGIFTEPEAEISARVSPRMIECPVGLVGVRVYRKPFWHETEEAAIKHAERMRVAKIDSLRKSLAKFEAMRFGKG